MEDLLKNTVFYKFDELSNLAEKIVNKLSKGNYSPNYLVSLLKDRQILESPELRLANYRNRFKTFYEDKNEFHSAQEPFEEFLILSYLIMQEGRPVSNEKDMIKDVIDSLARIRDQNFDKQGKSTKNKIIKESLQGNIQDKKISDLLFNKFKEN